jgi:hypothetical protein
MGTATHDKWHMRRTPRTRRQPGHQYRAPDWRTLARTRRTRSTSSTAATRMGAQLLMEPNRADRPCTSDTCGDGCRSRSHRSTCSRIDGSAGHTVADLAGFLRGPSLEPLLGRTYFGTRPPSSSWHEQCSLDTTWDNPRRPTSHFRPLAAGLLSGGFTRDKHLFVGYASNDRVSAAAAHAGTGRRRLQTLISWLAGAVRGEG